MPFYRNFATAQGAKIFIGRIDHWIPRSVAAESRETTVMVPRVVFIVLIPWPRSSQTRPRQQPTFRHISEKCWAAMLADKDLQQLCERRRLKHQARSGDE